MPSRPRIIGVVTAANRRDDKAWDALSSCDMAEFRGDTMLASASGDAAKILPELLRGFREECARRLGRVPETLVTLRLRRDGGAWPDEEAAGREPVWGALAAAGGGPRTCEWLDLETEEAGRVPRSLRAAIEARGIKVLVSHHNFLGTYPLPELRRKLAGMSKAHPAGVKFALTCAGRAELADLLAFAREVAAGRPQGGVFSMGEAGRSSRVLAPLLGCPFTYGYLTGGPVAPGQLSAAELSAFFAGAPFPPADDAETLIDWAEGRLQEAGLVR